MRQYRLRRAPQRAPGIVVEEWTIEVDADGAALLCADTEPVFASARLDGLLRVLGVEERDLVEVIPPAR